MKIQSGKVEDSQVFSLEGNKKEQKRTFLFFPGKACPDSSQVPKPPSRHWGSETALTAEGQREGITSPTWAEANPQTKQEGAKGAEGAGQGPCEPGLHLL